MGDMISGRVREENNPEIRNLTERKRKGNRARRHKTSKSNEKSIKKIK